MKFMKRITTFLLAVSLLAGVIPGLVQAEEPEGDYYNPEDDKLTHLELLEQLCTGFPYVGYERFPEVPQYFQQDYEHVPYGGWNGNVATHGCGITALAMLATYMTDTELTPEDLAEPFKRYSSDAGTEFALFDDSPGMLGYYLEKRSSSWKEAFAALEQGQMVISLQFAGHFTTTAHFIVLTGINEEGKIMVKDSNVFNHTKRFAGKDYYETGFDPGYVAAYGRLWWIYEKKVVRVPGCDRCEDPAVETVAICTETHYCTKCAELLNKRGAYHEGMAAVRVKPEI